MVVYSSQKDDYSYQNKHTTPPPKKIKPKITPNSAL